MEAKIKEKHWQKEFEPPIYEAWKKNKSYAFDKNSGKPVYSIDTPPPYVNAPIHMGHACTYVLMDMFARFHRMIGHEVLFPLGLDRNGLPIEMAAERKFKVKFTDVSREEALEYCRKLLETSSLASVESFLRSGISFNSWEMSPEAGDIYETDNEDYRKLTQETFIDLWNNGLVYEDARINNWCPGCQTTLADAEIVYEELPSAWNQVIFKVKETDEDIIIGTTRPELICTCGMIIFHPDDERYKHLDGKTAITPIFGKEVPIKAHPQAVIEKGTGIVMMCSAGDISDIRFFREQKLKPAIAINKDGTMNEHAGFLQGLKVKEAQKKICEDLKAKGLLVEQQQMTHRTPICERSKDPVEFIEMSELYVKQIEFKDDLRKIAHELNFYNDSARQILLNWIDSVSIDWPISRRRYYATEIPLWWCKKCKKGVVPEKGKYYKPWKEKAPFDSCPECDGKEFEGETRVFDTWFDSSNTPLYVIKYARDQEFFDKHHPCSLRPQGKEIVRTWLYYTLLKAFLLTGKSVFKDVWIHMHIVDENGNKMSKSAGNIIDPKDILDKFGAEPFRLWTTVEGNITQIDLRCSFDRIEGANKTLSKLWNVARFVSMFPEEKGPPSTVLDKWIVTELNRLISLAREKYEKYDFYTPVVQLRHFVRETFASHYLELVKNRAYNKDGLFPEDDQKSALSTLHYCLDIMLKLLAPVIPLMTERLYKDLRGKEIHSESFPEKVECEEPPFTVTKLTELNSAIWKAKKDSGISLKAPVKKVVVPEKFKSIEKDLKNMHNIESLSYGDLNISA